MRNQIQKLSDNTLLDEVKVLVRREKELVARVIEYLKEIEIRKLHLARGYSSLFAFATEFLGYSEAEAHTRIQAARLTQALPEVKTLLESGDLTLSVAATTQNYIRKENLRRKEVGKPNLTLPEQREVLELVSGSSRREAEQALSNHFGQTSEKRMSFDASPELVEKIEKLLDLMAHKNFDRDLGKMVKLLVEGELARYERTLKVKVPRPADDVEPTETSSLSLLAHAHPWAPAQVRSKPQRCSKREHSCFSESSRRRHIPRATRALVWSASKGRCTYQDPLTGKRCQATHGLEVDHRLALSKGGANEPKNFTLLCRSHNHWKSERQVE